MAKNESTTPLSQLSVKKSNELIASKYKSNLLENKIMAIGLARVEVINDRTGEERLEAKFYPGELAEIIGNEENIYRDLKKVSKTMQGHSIFIEDGRGNFKSYSIVPTAEYENGIFTIKFNPDLKKHILNLSGNYTTMQLSVLTAFDKNSSFRIYELLQKELYKSNPNINGGVVEAQYNISELKFMIGLVNIDDKRVQNRMSQMGKNIDWDELFSLLDTKEQIYPRWYDFQKRVLIPAQEECLKKSYLAFEYEPIKDGRSIKRVMFHISKNKPADASKLREKEAMIKDKIILSNDGIEVVDEQYEQVEYPRMYHEKFYSKYVGHNKMTEQDIDSLMIKANWEEAIVEEAIKAADKEDHLESYVGWIYRFIERGGYDKIETIDGSANRADLVNQVIDKSEELTDEEKKNLNDRQWERTKKKAKYKDFVREVELQFNTTIEEIVGQNDTESLNKAYADFIAKREIILKAKKDKKKTDDKDKLEKEIAQLFESPFIDDALRLNSQSQKEIIELMTDYNYDAKWMFGVLGQVQKRISQDEEFIRNYDLTKYLSLIIKTGKSNDLDTVENLYKKENR